MVFSQNQYNKLLGKSGNSIFSKQSDFWNRKPNDDFNKKKPKGNENE